jgi:outer membrane lipoprotein-sorting protein
VISARVATEAVRYHAVMAAPRSRRHLSIARAAAPLLAIALLLPGVPSAQPPDLFDEIYRRGQAFEQGLRTIRANFTETSTSRLLKQPLVASGVLAVERPAKIALHYRAPEARTILIDGDTLQMAWPARALSQRKDIGAALGRVQKYFVGASPKELRSHFAIAAAVDPESPAHWRVQMTPTRRQIKEGIARIDLRIAQASLMLTSMQMTFANGDLTALTFDQVVTNEPLAPELFRLPR